MTLFRRLRCYIIGRGRHRAEWPFVVGVFLLWSVVGGVTMPTMGEWTESAEQIIARQKTDAIIRTGRLKARAIQLNARQRECDAELLAISVEWSQLQKDCHHPEKTYYSVQYESGSTCNICGKDV